MLLVAPTEQGSGTSISSSMLNPQPLVGPMPDTATVELIELPMYLELDNITVTIYHPVPEQCDDTPFITASLAQIDSLNPGKHRWIALSRDLKKKLAWGDTVVLSGDDIPTEYLGEWYVQDVMNKRFTNSIDLLVDYSVKTGKWNDATIKFQDPVWN